MSQYSEAVEHQVLKQVEARGKLSLTASSRLQAFTRAQRCGLIVVSDDEQSAIIRCVCVFKTDRITAPPHLTLPNKKSLS
jgi:hypothetical protein